MLKFEKVRKLFSFTTNFQNYYFWRLIHWNVHVINQAKQKLKYKENTFLQYQLIEKIMNYIIIVIFKIIKI